MSIAGASRHKWIVSFGASAGGTHSFPSLVDGVRINSALPISTELDACRPLPSPSTPSGGACKKHGVIA